MPPVRVRSSFDSGYNRLTGTVLVKQGLDEIDRYETVAHELGHRLTDSAAGWGGLIYAGAPGSLAEGLSETLSAAAVGARYGEGEGLRRLNPEGKSLPMNFFGEVPIPTHLKQMSWKYLDDLGGVHLNCGPMRQAHSLLAQQLGLAGMAGLVFQAIPELKPWSTLSSFARLTHQAALNRGDEKAAQAVQDAWTRVGVCPWQ